MRISKRGKQGFRADVLLGVGPIFDSILPGRKRARHDGKERSFADERVFHFQSCTLMMMTKGNS